MSGPGENVSTVSGHGAFDAPRSRAWTPCSTASATPPPTSWPRPCWRCSPEAKYAIGPPIENGFYYDFELPRPLTPEDLDAHRQADAESIAADKPFVRSSMSKDEARAFFADQPYKLELIDGIPDAEVGICKHGNFTDLCGYPHVESTGKVGAFKLTSVAGAYWRGDEHRQMLQRIYGVMFPTEAELAEHLHRLEEAERRDHRRLGRELELFFVDPIAPGSPFFLPKGATVYNLMIGFMRGLYGRYGYQEVITPQIFSTDLWKRSGHYDNYKDDMYFIQAEDRELGVKPMNCPGHCVMFGAQVHSYRELPLRYADFGRLHRFERSGALHGLTRVRSFAQDDAHIYCSLDQVGGEILSLVAMMRETYEAFGLGQPRFTLSLRPDKRIGTDEVWDQAEGGAARRPGRLRRAVRGGAERGRLLRPEDRPVHGRRAGPRVADQHLPARLQHAGALRPALRRRRRHPAAAGDDPPRHPRLDRALHGASSSSRRRGAFPTWLAPVQANAHPDRRPPRRVLRGRRGAPARRPACASRSTRAASACRRRSATPSCRRCRTCSSPATATSRPRPCRCARAPHAADRPVPLVDHLLREANDADRHDGPAKRGLGGRSGPSLLSLSFGLATSPWVQRGDRVGALANP